MKLRPTILALFLALFHAHAERKPDAFYVWQQRWSSNVVAAVSGEAATTLYPLASVVPSQGKSSLADIPWHELGAPGHRYIPVIRIPLNAFKRTDIGRELSSITRQLIDAARPVSFDGIQLDLDCPERLLPRYADLVKTYRKEWPKIRLSITALPAHLNNGTFRPLAEATDYYVLQVHGLDVPKQRGDPAELLNLKTAEQAIRQAEKLGHPYRIALPCYAYELNFDPDTGAFLFLTAERPARRTETVKTRIAAKPADLLKLLETSKTLECFQGIVWFRLPVAGDRLCLPRSALAAIQSGSIPEQSVRCNVLPVSATTCELELVNGNTIDASFATIALAWPHPDGSFDLYQDAVATQTAPGKLPESLTVPMPPPGRSIKLGWFQSGTNDKPNLEIELK